MLFLILVVVTVTQVSAFPSADERILQNDRGTANEQRGIYLLVPQLRLYLNHVLCHS